MSKRSWLGIVALVAGLVLLAGCSETKMVSTTGINAASATVTKSVESVPAAPGTGSRCLCGDIVPIYFDRGKSNLRADQMANLKASVDYLKAHADLKVRLEGYCDERGGEKPNLALGERRAKAVREFLVKNGVAADRLSVVSKGEIESPYGCHCEMVWAMYRRVDFEAAH
jgi:peptidoglycan-associated lipoprotein